MIPVQIVADLAAERRSTLLAEASAGRQAAQVLACRPPSRITSTRRSLRTRLRRLVTTRPAEPAAATIGAEC